LHESIVDGAYEFTWANTDPTGWYLLVYPITDLSLATDVSPGSFRSFAAEGPNSWWIVGSDDGVNPSTDFSNVLISSI
jgi:hypothetical protein